MSHELYDTPHSADTSVLFLWWWRPARLYHFLWSRNGQGGESARGERGLDTQRAVRRLLLGLVGRRACKQLNLTRPTDSFSATAKNMLNESIPVYSAYESRCWLTAHSLR